MLSRRFNPLLFIISLTLFCFASLANALDQPHVQVSASATVKAQPDFIRIHINIDKVSKQRSKAKNHVDRVTQQVINVAKQLGVKDEHIDAAQIFMQPEYRWDRDGREYMGEKVNRTVNIKLYALDQYSELANQLAKLDITYMQQQGFGFDNIEAYQDEAMLMALEKAEKKAKKIAKKVRKKLKTVFQVSEAGHAPSPVYRQPMMKAQMEMAEAGGAPLEVKAQDVRSTVNVIFLID